MDVFWPLRLKKRKIFVRFVVKMLKFVILKCWNHSTTTKNYAVA